MSHSASIRRFALVTLLAALLALGIGCQSAMPAPLPPASAAPPAAASAAPTGPAAGTAVLVPITPDNAAQVSALAEFQADSPDTLPPVTALAYAPDGGTVVAGRTNGMIEVWQIAGGTLVRSIQTTSPRGGALPVVTGLAFSPDGQFLGSTYDDGTAIIWRIADATPAQFLAATRGGGLACAAFSPDGRTFAAGASDGAVYLWSVPGGPAPRLLEGHANLVLGVAFRAGDQALVSGGLDGTVRVWGADGTLAVLQVPALVHSLTLSPDGRALAIGTWGGGVEVQQDGLRYACAGHTGAVLSLAFSPDGRVLASGAADGTVRLWDERGNSVAVLAGAMRSVAAVVFSPAGDLLVTGGDDGVIRLWGVAQPLPAPTPAPPVEQQG